MHIFGIDFLELLIQFGLWMAVLIIFAESSIIFFLPGDSFLFAAGLVASQGYFSLYLLMLLCVIAGVLGNNFGYYLGNRLGEKFFRQNRSFLFKKKYIDKASDYYNKYGAPTLVLARYIPIVRTFAPIVAGLGKMNYPTFFTYNLLGCAMWVFSMTILGYFLGETIPNIDKYILPIVLVIIIFSILPAIVAIIRSKSRSN